MESALKECAESMPPIIGAINASMDIYDTPLESMIYVQWVRGLESKISTSFNMHQHLPVGSLDFFILLSSLAGIYGTIAQSNYAAGCTFQDAIARYRAEQGENAVSVDIGWMRSVGKIAETEEYQRNRENQRDMLQVETEELLSLLSVYCQPKNGQKPQVLLGAITPAYFLDRGETPAPLLQRPMFTSFAQMLESDKPKSASNANDPARLFQQAATAEEQAQVVVHAVMARLGRALGVSADDIEPTKQLSDYGVDSLMAVELRNWIGKEFKANVAVFDLTGGASIIALGELVAERTEI
jgi:acyl carrier protein